MQALLLTEYRKLELTSLDRPTVGPDDVLIAVEACGICGSDVHGYDGSTGRRIPPIVMGHEAAGVIAEVGAEVERLAIGDRVTFDSTIHCGHCDACRQGKFNLCIERRILGVSCGEFHQHGAFAEFVGVPQHIVHRLPENLPCEHAAFAEPVSIALHAVGRLRVSPGDRAVVVGSGMIGLLVIQVLRLAGCEEVIAIDVVESRLRLAAELGATATIDAANDPVAGVLEHTGGRGADVALEVVGNAAALATAIGSVRRGGHVCLVGNVQPEVPLRLQDVVSRELTLAGSSACAGEYPQAIDLLATGKIRVATLLSAVASLADGPQWFDRLYAREPGLMKVILCPSREETSHGQSV